MNTITIKRFMLFGLLLFGISLSAIGMIFSITGADHDSSIPEIGMVTIDIKGISSVDERQFAENTLRAIDGVTSATLRGNTAGVTFRLDRLNEHELMKKINAQGSYAAFKHQFNRKDLANVCPIPPGLEHAIVIMKSFFGIYKNNFWTSVSNEN